MKIKEMFGYRYITWGRLTLWLESPRYWMFNIDEYVINVGPFDYVLVNHGNFNRRK